jgi:predicted PurR-regulated permease PerM
MTSLAMRGCFIAMIVIGLIALAIFGIYAMINSEWFQEALHCFQKVGAWFSNVGEWFQNLGEWAKNWFTRKDKKFLAF